MKVVLASLFLATVVLAQRTPNFAKSRNTIVQLFEWPFQNIAEECEDFLGPNGFAGVQISPVSENLIFEGRPWFERYQPISYIIGSRSGEEPELKDMIARCSKVGVRTYVDVVLNHMTADAVDPVGTEGSTCDTSRKYYPAVPYFSIDFHESCAITDYNDKSNIRNCEINGNKDLDQSKTFVRGKQIEFLNHLIQLGVAGFRVDLAYLMEPVDLEYIYSQLNDTVFGGRPYIFQEVVDLGDDAVSVKDYDTFGAVTEFKFSVAISHIFGGIDHVLADLNNIGPAWGFVDSDIALAFVDNHDQQRGVGAGGDTILTYKNNTLYKMAQAFALAYPYGTARVVSGYYFDTLEQGPPQDSAGNIVGPVPNSQGTCNNGWVCEHRWREIHHMVEFRNVVEGTEVTNWSSNGDNQIAFCREKNGFIVFTLEGDIDQVMQTCLPPGAYCDVITGSPGVLSCTGSVVIVDINGYGVIRLSQSVGVLALHIGARAL